MQDINMIEPSGSTPPEQKPNETTISTIDKCDTKKVSKLCLLDLSEKLKNSNDYDIGGSYTGDTQDFWFYYTTSMCPGPNYLLNLFVHSRKVVNFKIGISRTSATTSKHNDGNMSEAAYLSDELEWLAFKAGRPSENYYIKTLCFNKVQVKYLENIMVYIPLMIKVDPNNMYDDNIIRQIKLNHQLGELLSKEEKTDFMLESATGKTYNVHKIIMAASSPKLREIIRKTSTEKAFLDINDNEMELLLQFMYTGFIEDIWKQDCIKLMNLATKFQLNNLFYMLQLVIQDQIDEDNAVEIALISEKYDLEDLQMTVFNFIKRTPAVFNSAGWKNLDNVIVAKKLFQYTNF